MIIIIIGLPGSGKTTYSNKLKLNNYQIFDDFISNFFNGNLIAALKNYINICINDPRLCDINIFNKYIKIIQNFVSKENISLVLFQNNYNACLKNLTDIKKINSLKYLSTKYDLDNYQLYNHIIIPVFEESFV